MDEISEIEQLDNELQAWEAAFAVAMVALNRSLLDALFSLLDRLAFHGRLTTDAEMMANFQAVISFQATLPSLVIQLGFDDIIGGMISNMGNSVDRLNAFYGGILSDFQPGAYQSFVNQLAMQVRSRVLDTVQATYQNAIGDVLTSSVMSKSTAAELRAILRERLENEGLSIRPVQTVASDALYTFSRAYSQAIAEGLNLKHYYYMGTQIATTRSFCSARFGKAFTQKEVEEWANLTWTGKIPGTTAVTIFWYCGGYNCRHRLLPISKTLYNNFLSKQQIN